MLVLIITILAAGAIFGSVGNFVIRYNVIEI